MSDPILVRGEISSGVAWSRTLVPLGVMLAIVLYCWAPPPAGLIVGLVFGIAWIWLELYAAWQRSRQVWVRDTGAGFDLIDRREERFLPDDRTSSVALKVERLFSNGVQKATRRVFTVWSELESDPIHLESRLKMLQPDPLAPMINRILQAFQKRTEVSLTEGEVLAGAGWQLNKTTLFWGKGDGKESIPRTEISACEEFDRQICVWRNGQDEAIAKFKIGTRNVCLLPALLQRTVPEAAAVSLADQSGLGRILFERRPTIATRITLAGLGLLMLLTGTLLALFAVQNPAVALLAGSGLILAGIGFAIAGYVIKFQSFRCHERGVVKIGLRSRKEIRYSEAGAFTYSATRQYHNGAYIGTAIVMHFSPLSGSNAPRISYSTSIKNEDSGLEELKSYISRAIAGRMAKQLAEGQEVPWTSNLTFVADGIRYRPPGFIGRKEAKQLSYQDYGGCSLDAGVFYLFQKGEKKAVTNEQAAAPNFYPGYCLLMMMQEPG
jgi:hypothetical protein